MVFPILPVLAAAGISAAGGLAAGWSMSSDNSSKKSAAAATAAAGSSSGGSSLFPSVEAAPFSITSPAYSYSDQSVQHEAYEQYQPTYIDSRQYDVTYPNYSYIIDSAGAVVSNKKESQLDNRTESTPTMQESYTPQSNSGNSSGIDPLLLIGGGLILVLALGGVAIATR